VVDIEDVSVTLDERPDYLEDSACTPLMTDVLLDDNAMGVGGVKRSNEAFNCKDERCEFSL
jgi:hypothetical protein